MTSPSSKPWRGGWTFRFHAGERARRVSTGKLKKTHDPTVQRNVLPRDADVAARYLAIANQSRHDELGGVAQLSRNTSLAPGRMTAVLTPMTSPLS